jgi:hypothetical protein
MAKIKVIQGNQPFMLIAPHGAGPTDLWSAEQTEHMAKVLDCSAVINVGWKRPWTGNIEGTNDRWPHEKLDIANGIANLNDTTHCRMKPLNDEFLRPINRLKSDIVLDYGKCAIYIIHGMDDIVRNYKGVDLVVGDGLGEPDRSSCTRTFSDKFISSLNGHFTPARGKPGGRFSGWKQTNLNQLFQNDAQIMSVQIEMGLSIRENLKDALKMGERLADGILTNHFGKNVKIMGSIPER